MSGHRHRRGGRITRTVELSLLGIGATLIASMLMNEAQADTGTSTLRIKQERVYILPDDTKDRVNIIEVLDVVNDTGTSEPVSVYLPSGWDNLSVDGRAADVQPVSGVLQLAGAAKAHTTATLTVSYQLPFRSDTGEEMTLHTPYAVDAAQLYLPIGNVALSAQGLLTTTQTTVVAGTNCRVFSRLGIAGGDDWTISLQRLPTADSDTAVPRGIPVIGAPMSDRANMMEAAGNLVMAGAVLVIGLLGVRSGQRRIVRLRTKASEEAILSELHQVEHDHRSGVLPVEVYERSKRQLLEQVVHIRLRREEQ